MELIGGMEPCYVGRGLFIGGIDCARNFEALERLGITHLISAIGNADAFSRCKLDYLNLYMEDNPSYDPELEIRAVDAYIREKRQAQPDAKFLVYCMAGISRSACLVMGHLILTHGMTFREALKDLRSAYPRACPNIGFQQRLAFLQNYPGKV